MRDDQKPVWVGAGKAAGAKDAEAAGFTIDAPAPVKPLRASVAKESGGAVSAPAGGAGAGAGGAGEAEESAESRAGVDGSQLEQPKPD